MIKETVGKFSIERYDDIDELIVSNYNLFNEYALVQSEVGSKMEDIYRHFRNLDIFLAQKKLEEAIQERRNQNQAFYHLLEKNNFPALQWCVLVKSVDGKELVDYSVPTLKALIEDLSKEGLTQGKVKADVDLAKKKSGSN